MSLTYISTPHLSTNRRRRSLPRSPKWGADWRHAVRNLRAAVEDAAPHAKWGVRRFTADRVGMTVLDHIDELNSRTLPILHVLVGELVRQSRK